MLELIIFPDVTVFKDNFPRFLMVLRSCPFAGAPESTSFTKRIQSWFVPVRRVESSTVTWGFLEK